MAKKGSKKSAQPVSPLYESGRLNGPVGGPKSGKSPRDPFGYLSNTGDAPPSGSPGDHGPAATDAPPSHHGR